MKFLFDLNVQPDEEFDLNAQPHEEEYSISCSEEARAQVDGVTETRPAAASESAHKIPPLPSTPTNAAENVIEGGSSSQNNRMRKRLAQEAKKGYGSIFRMKATTVPIHKRDNEEATLVDDGYDWYKYGQKTMKGVLFPRVYYRCTIDGCFARKQVDRNPINTQHVITTYLGKHNHEPHTNKKQRVDGDGEGDEKLGAAAAT